MSSSRHPRFKRSATVDPIRLTERDRTIIQTVYKHRFLSSSHLIKLLGESRQPILRRLQLLYHHGFLERPRAQINYYHKGGSRHIVYGIGNKGAALLKQELGLPLRVLRWSEKNRAVGRIFLEHALLVSDVMVAFEIACRESSKIQFLTEDQLPTNIGDGHRSFHWNVTLSTGEKLGIIPDRIFALKYSGEAGKCNRAFFFLEADRGTMPIKRRQLSQTSFYRKLLGYEATWAQSIHRSRFGFHRFRVLTITTSAGRLRSLAEACSQLKSGHGLFLFTDQKLLGGHTNVLSSIWQTWKQGEIVSLLN